MGDLFPLFDPSAAGQRLLLIAIAYVLALPTAMNREASNRIMGLRTFPLVAMACCGFVLLADRSFSDSPEAAARVLQGVITGIGFIGGGAILKNGGDVRGTATAASIWNTGAIGATVALQRFEIAITLSVATFLTLHFMGKAKSEIDHDEPSAGRDDDGRSGDGGSR